MGGVIRIALALSLSTSCAWAYDYPTECIIVTDGSASIYRHEQAHCNGWRHAPFSPVLTPPAQFDYPYPGKVTVIVGVLSMDFLTWMMMTHSNKRGYTYENRTVPEICQRLWDERGVAGGSFLQMSSLRGCQVWPLQ